uniref:Uncharacterized protein n=1 Tax=Rhodymenia pseudopalmata TaxID=31502 RepID=A0A1C9C7J1_RHOPU|nr:hypothetical protein Rhodyp_062 [Rhodymenia pseudopalmata]AOM64340.1 hypothetical protein Rhodyp_062 [Rhodymenia pseudopalmata]
MESLEHILNSYNSSDINELSTETLEVWSSACLDETISYYTDCNSALLQSKEKEDKN